MNTERVIPLSSFKKIEMEEKDYSVVVFFEKKDKLKTKKFVFEEPSKATELHKNLIKLFENFGNSRVLLSPRSTFSKWYGRVVCIFDYE
jgi:hypothetical protein